MGLPAFLATAQGSASPLDADQIALSSEVQERCSALWETARAEWSAEPTERSEGEDRAIAATVALMLEVSRAITMEPRAALRALVHQGLRRVLREQRSSADDARVFALRQVEQALEHYGVAVEAIEVAAGVDGVGSEFAVERSPAQTDLPPELRPLLRAHGALLMAFDAMASGSDAELRHWARHAVEAWRAVVASLGSLTAIARAAGAHSRARRSWSTWTDDDRASEASAWKTLL